MHATPDILFKRLDDLGIAIETHNHSPVFTVEKAKAHCAHLPGSHCKNLFLKDKKGVFWLIVTLDERPINMKSLRKLIGSHHLSFGKPELLGEVLGVKPGSVTPFALINDTEGRVNVVLDKKMMEMDLLNYHPLTNGMTTTITPSNLLTFIRDTDHNPALVEL
jgi:Ala-tRNA(Pro) deacylase